MKLPQDGSFTILFFLNIDKDVQMGPRDYDIRTVVKNGRSSIWPVFPS